MKKQNDNQHVSKWILFLSLHDVPGIDMSDKCDLMSCLSCCLVTSSDESTKEGLLGRISLTFLMSSLCPHSDDTAHHSTMKDD